MKFDLKLKPFEYITEEQVGIIHQQSLDILENVGIKVYNKDLLTKLKKSGIKVDGDIVKFTKEDLKDALISVKNDFKLYGTDDSKNIIINKENKVVGTHSNAVQYFDYNKNILRDSTYDDLVNYTKVAEASDLVGKTGPGCTAKDVVKENQLLIGAKAVLLNTTKPMTLTPHNFHEMNYYLDIDRIVRGNDSVKNNPRFLLGISTTSPLQIDNDTCKNLMLCAEEELPIQSAPAPMGGATSPYTLAGTLLLTNAEALFILICSQVLNPGLGFVWGGASCIMDLRNATVGYGSAERALIIGANAQMARWYGLPSATPAGSVDAWSIDVQQGLQKMIAFITRTFSYGTLFVSAGSTNNGLAVSCEQILIDLEMIKMCMRFANGINFEEDATALEAIKRVGHGGNYMMDDHTLKWLKNKKETIYMDLINISGPSGKSMLEKAGDMVEKIISENQQIYSDSIIQEVDRYVEDNMK